MICFNCRKNLDHKKDDILMMERDILVKGHECTLVATFCSSDCFFDFDHYGDEINES